MKNPILIVAGILFLISGLVGIGGGIGFADFAYGTQSDALAEIETQTEIILDKYTSKPINKVSHILEINPILIIANPKINQVL